MKEYLASAEDVLKEQSTSADAGLSTSEAQTRQAKFGPNKLKEEEKTPLWIRFFQQMADPMVIMLIVAAVISAVTGMIQGESEWADVVIIMAVVIINSALGVIQEAKSEEALAALQEMSAAQSKVIRDGKQISLHSSELVPGDIVLLEAGDAVPADCRVLESASMKIEEAALTGESVPVEKHTDPIALDGADDVPLGDRKNMCYMGSTVVYGRGRAVVCGTGMNTEMGKIAGALNDAKEELTPLQVKLAELSKILTILVIVICVVVFAVDVLRAGIGTVTAEPHMLLDTFMVAVSLAVAAIPEGLVAVVTIVLSIGVTKMAKRQAIIRNLSAVETLGCTQVICSDKTGTLTQNKMTVVNHELAAPEEKLLAGMALCSDAKWDEEAGEAVGEPTECALVNDAAKMGMKGLDEEHPRVGEAPFDSGRKMMSVVVEEADGNFEQYTKGAPDVVVGLCTQVYDGDKIVPMTDERREQILAANKAMADQALRVLALASRTYTEKPADFAAEALENNLVFCGLSGMIDPERPEVAPAIEEAHGAGIRTVMITGDHASTARAIGRELDIFRPGDLVVTGAELDEMDDAALDEAARNTSVFARVSPLHKLRIVRALQHAGEVCAMTGDGVNDAPALKAADIGVAMGITGTDVAKDASDMILMDDRFTTIVYAVREGRRVFRNIQKVVSFLVADNVAQIVVLLTAVALNWNAPLTAVMILWVNLATASLPALALGVEPASRHIMEHPPMRVNNLLDGPLARRVIFQGVFIAALALVAFVIGQNAGSYELGCTMAFGVLGFSQVLRSLNQRSATDPVWDREGARNRQLGLAAAASIALMLVVLLVPPFIDAFGGTTMDLGQWALVVGFALLSVVQTEIAKAIGRWRARR